MIFFKNSSWKQFSTISSPFSWVAKLRLVESMTQNICSTSAEDACNCSVASRSKSIPYCRSSSCSLRNEQTSMNYLLLTVNNLYPFIIYKIFTFNYHIFQFKTNIHGLIYPRPLYYLSLSFMALYTQSISFGLILHNFHWISSVCKLKTRSKCCISPSPTVRNRI